MTLPQVYELFEYWQSNPPEHEIAALFAQVYTTWKPIKKTAPEDDQRQSLEQRWKHGALNVKQLFETMGGSLSTHGGVGSKMTGDNLPGIGPFPGTMH